MLSVVKVATPPTAVTVALPASVAPDVPVPVAIAIVTSPAKSNTGLPRPSRAITCTAGAMALPAAALRGLPVNDSLAATPAVATAAGRIDAVRAGRGGRAPRGPRSQ